MITDCRLSQEEVDSSLCSDDMESVTALMCETGTTIIHCMLSAITLSL